METKNLIIICVTAILCICIIAGAFVLLNDGSNNNEVNPVSSDDNSVNSNKVDSVSSEDNSANSSSNNGMRIQNGSVNVACTNDGKTVCDVYVGTEHANEHVQISVLFKRDGLALNQGKIVPTTVTSDGYVIVKTADPLDEMPDYALINLYDENGNLLDNRMETLDEEKIYNEF